MEKEIKFKRNLILKRIIFLALLLATFYIIFNFSSQNGIESGNISRKVTTFIVEMLSKIKTMDSSMKLHYIAKLHPIVRKLAHFSIYTLVGFSVMGLMCTFNIKNKFKVFISIVIGVIYAVADEIHQNFTPGRLPSPIDVCIDSLGVFTGIFIMVLLVVFVEAIVNWFKR